MEAGRVCKTFWADRRRQVTYSYVAWVFILGSLYTGQRLAFGLICPDARYIARVLCNDANAKAVRHRQVSAALWRELLHEFSMGLNPGPLPKTSAIHKALTDGVRDVAALRFSTCRSSRSGSRIRSKWLRDSTDC
jgi:hypothetical protein